MDKTFLRFAQRVRDVQRDSGRLVKMTVTEWIANEKGLI